jgi:hypothetical protein
MMAEAFWAMGSEEQVAFFDELARVIREDHETNSNAYALGELQWHFMCGGMEGDKYRAPRDMLMSIAAPLYLNTLRNTYWSAA